MADTSVNFKCPNCTGPLSYVPGQSEIVCEYCGTRLSVADLEAYYARKEEQAAKAEQAKEQNGIRKAPARRGVKTSRKCSGPSSARPAAPKS